ncbi:MAG: hypothetical protein R3E13_07955 [Alphaproteobacteria bacterium]
MEFVSKDADMILVKTNPEELQKLAAIMRACHEFDFVLCEMDSEHLLALAERFEKAEQDSWVFHNRELFHLGSIMNLAIRGMDIERFNAFSARPFTREELEKIEHDIDQVYDLARQS